MPEGTSSVLSAHVETIHLLHAAAVQAKRQGLILLQGDAEDAPCNVSMQYDLEPLPAELITEQRFSEGERHLTSSHNLPGGLCLSCCMHHMHSVISSADTGLKAWFADETEDAQNTTIPHSQLQLVCKHGSHYL